MLCIVCLLYYVNKLQEKNLLECCRGRSILVFSLHSTDFTEQNAQDKFLSKFGTHVIFSFYKD